jgi:DNA polymerase (family 10)
MSVHNADIAVIFDEIADLLEIEGENPFRIRAYRNTARTLRDLGREITNMLEQGEDLTELPGIGEDLAAKIQEIVATGTTPLLGKLRKKVPPALTELLHLPGLGPKRVKALYHELDIHTLEQLYRAALDGRIRTVPGFGEKTEQHLLQAIKARTETAARCKLAVAAQYADALVA